MRIKITLLGCFGLITRIDSSSVLMKYTVYIDKIIRKFSTIEGINSFQKGEDVRDFLYNFETASCEAMWVSIGCLMWHIIFSLKGEGLSNPVKNVYNFGKVLENISCNRNNRLWYNRIILYYLA